VERVGFSFVKDGRGRKLDQEVALVDWLEEGWELCVPLSTEGRAKLD